MKTAFAFTGQGSQKKGMAMDFYEESAAVREKLAAAKKITGLDFLNIFENDPENMLSYTPVTQPSVVLFEAAVSDLLKDEGIIPSAVMGHSLGEYSAIYAAGIVDFNDIISIAAKRGELMQAAADQNPGTMAAILGLSKEQVSAICKKAADAGVVSISNVNLPTQIVISGVRAAVEKASALAKEDGARRVVPLSVSGPFHSSLMTGAKDSFEEELARFDFSDSDITFISNNAGQTLNNGAEIKKLLLKQFVTGVDWVRCVNSAEKMGIDTIIEIGPGAVLTPMIRKIAPEMKTYTVTNTENFKNLLQNFV